MGRAVGRIEILSDPLALAHHVAEWMTAHSASRSLAVRRRGRCMDYSLRMSSEVVSPGGAFPGTGATSGLSRTIIPTARMAREAMLIKAQVPPENIYPIPTDGTPQDAARRYEQTLQDAYGAATLDPQRPLFDVTLLGLGPDGHTASLLPGEPVLNERRHWAAAVSHGRPEVRITMTYPAIESSRRVAFLVAGKEKAEIFSGIRAGNSQVPAARIRPVGELCWFVDRAAAGTEQVPSRTGARAR
jgi:6-phosphogluconolactonase